MGSTQRSGNRFRALVTFTMFCLIGLVGLGAATWLPGYIAGKLIEKDLRAFAPIWERRVLRHMAQPYDSFRQGRVDNAGNEALWHIPEASEIFRFVLFDHDGHAIWSNYSEDRTLRLSAEAIQTTLIQGQIQYEHQSLSGQALHGNEPDHDEPDHATSGHAHTEDAHVAVSTGDGDMHQIVTLTIPVTDAGQIVGAIKFCSDITIMQQTLVERLRIALFVAVGIGLSLTLFVVWVVYRSGRSKVADLKESAAKERELMESQMQLAREVRLLGELNEWLQSSRSLDELFKMVARFMTHILPECAGSVYVYSNSRDVLDGAASWNGGSHLEHMHPEDCWGLRRGRSYVYGDSEVDFTCDHAEPHDHRPYFCFPILAHGETVGLMHLKTRDGGSDTAFRQGQKLAQMCAEQISMAIANVQMRDQLQDQSIRDPLTGLYNRRHMTETLRRLMGRSPKGHAKLSVVSIDVDHFKKFNDNHGHDAGDMVLRAVGSMLEQHCDGDEIACRMGGEEFMLLLPDTTAMRARDRAEALRLAVENILVRYGEKALPRITISIGIAVHPDHGTFPQDVMRVADDALYQAKAKGRNQVVLADLQKDSLNESDTPPIDDQRPDLAAE